MKKILLISLLMLLVHTLSAQEKNTQLLTLTLIETFRGAILPKMFITYTDGTPQEEIPLESLGLPATFRDKRYEQFLENVKSNEQIILQKLDDLQKAGWQLLSVTTNVLSSDPSGQAPVNNQVIYTRYIFKR